MKLKIIFLMMLGLVSVRMSAQEPDTKAAANTGNFYHYICDCGCHSHPVNNYSGLNSLRARLAGQDLNGTDSINGGHSWSMSSMKGNSDNSELNADSSIDVSDESNETDSYTGKKTSRKISSSRKNSDLDSSSEEYLASIAEHKITVGAPVYVFFKLGSTTLTEESQMVNVDAIAEVAKCWHLKVRITGAADSATGSEDTNLRLSEARALYVSDLMKKQGIEETMIEIQNDGGISSFSPMPANRHCRIELFM